MLWLQNYWFYMQRQWFYTQRQWFYMQRQWFYMQRQWFYLQNHCLLRSVGALRAKLSGAFAELALQA
ncbi:MAG: hypothetical protein J5905_07755 [Prevotella sp.]|nr:hypothetical protein [Prevotella sp.]MBO5614371.1 hypothetical protein [Prevotella sp.]